MKIFYCEEAAGREGAYALLAWSARRCWGWEALPALSRGEQGKPRFPGYPGHCFNLSHSGALALCVLDSRPAGADVERVRPRRRGLEERFCGGEQLEWLRGQADRDRALCRLWTLKECRVKYTGTGLTVPLRAVPVPLPPPEDGVVEMDGLFYRLFAGESWCAAVCGLTAPEDPVRVSPQALWEAGGFRP